MLTIRQTIRQRDNASEGEIDDMFDEARMMIQDGEDPEQVIGEVFGLEPDYLYDPELDLRQA